MGDSLKLFVWEDVLCDYTCGVAFALAPDVETARRMCADDYAGWPGVAQVGDYQRWRQGDFSGYPTKYSPGYYVPTFWRDLSREPLIVEQAEAFLVGGGS